VLAGGVIRLKGKRGKMEVRAQCVQ
jgi:hypothetical protein